jgi:tetratricopeptide (TPR) repeat protein
MARTRLQRSSRPRPTMMLVTFRHEAVYRTGPAWQRLVIPVGTQLVGFVFAGDAEPVLHVGMTALALHPQFVELMPIPDRRLSLRSLALQTETTAQEATERGDDATAAMALRQAAVQYRLLGESARAAELEREALHAHNRHARTPEVLAHFDGYVAELSDEALRQLGATVRLILRQLGGWHYQPASLAEAQTAWETVRLALLQVANRDNAPARRPHATAASPITPTTQWVTAEHLVGDLLVEPQGPPERIAALADVALALDPDDADGYLLQGGLAAAAGDWMTARRWYEDGVRAGERKLGAAFFSDPERPRFWLAVETRPYMRARAALADARYHLGDLAGAIAECWGMLALNPGDNQGMRDVLASWLLEQRDHDGFQRLYQIYATLGDADDDDDDPFAELPRDLSQAGDATDPERLIPYDGAHWLFPAALFHFQREGDTARARATIQLAHAQNRYVLPLLKKKKPPTDEPSGYSPGSQEEALVYARDGHAAWAVTPGAVAWALEHKSARPRSRRTHSTADTES